MISVVMSVYNESEALLFEAVDSILRQTEKRFELIIVLDNPQNKIALKQIKEFREKDSRVRMIENIVNIGLASSLNKAISLAQYDIIARMDADDISLENRFERELVEIKNGYDFVFSKYVVIDEDGNMRKEVKGYTSDEKMLKKSISIKNCVCHPTAMFRKKIFENVGGYSILPVVEDYDLWKKFIAEDVRMKAINEVLLKYRVRTSSMTTSNYFKSYTAWRYIRAKHSKLTHLKKNVDFLSYYSAQAGKQNSNEQNYNRLIVEYYNLRDSWGTINQSKYFKLLKIMISNYRIALLLFDSFRANYFRQKNESNSNLTI